MKIVFCCVVLILGYTIHGIVDRGRNYERSVELAQSNCKILALSNPKIDLSPAEINCKLISDDDFLLTVFVQTTEIPKS